MIVKKKKNNINKLCIKNKYKHISDKAKVISDHKPGWHRTFSDKENNKKGRGWVGRGEKRLERHGERVEKNWR